MNTFEFIWFWFWFEQTGRHKRNATFPGSKATTIPPQPSPQQQSTAPNSPCLSKKTANRYDFLSMILLLILWIIIYWFKVVAACSRQGAAGRVSTATRILYAADWAFRTLTFCPSKTHPPHPPHPTVSTSSISSSSSSSSNSSSSVPVVSSLSNQVNWIKLSKNVTKLKKKQKKLS